MTTKQENIAVTSFLKKVLSNMPQDWLQLTTHRLDIYNEEKAKVEFLEELEKLYKEQDFEPSVLENLPTAYDYIRLGHPLSSVLEWTIAKMYSLTAENVISFQSNTIPLMAILRRNHFLNKETHIFPEGELPSSFDAEKVKNIYNYRFKIPENTSEVKGTAATSVLYTVQDNLEIDSEEKKYDFVIKTIPHFGNILLMNKKDEEGYIDEIQHVRRRETVAMTPVHCLEVLKSIAYGNTSTKTNRSVTEDKATVLNLIKNISGTAGEPLVASSGLSIQYAIMMGLIEYAKKNFPEKKISFLVPPNCYGGTNDQARRVAACVENVEIVDLPVDRDNEMDSSLEILLDKVASEDAVPFIIAEIPTNPRVEVPNLDHLKEVLEKERTTAAGEKAVAPVFVVDQTFCPNFRFLDPSNFLVNVKALSYTSGSKFPSGGKCTAGYCVGNDKTAEIMEKIKLHLLLCDNEATPEQYGILAEQLPSMNQRIKEAYKNTKDFVKYVHNILPEAKINFVSEELAQQGFTPSVFSLDLPAKGNSVEEKEAHKRDLNLKLINKMIHKIPAECKFCVSYGQLKGSYWTIPATSTQGTTKEGDKDYIVRISISPNLDLQRHKEIFREFVEENLR